MSDILSPRRLTGEESFEKSLRPRTFNEFIGQRRVVSNLKVFVYAARERGESLDHVLLHGPAGLGKTTLAMIIAREMGGRLRISSGPAIERPGDLASILSSLEDGDILFIDEIHRLHPSVEEVLYAAMEDFALDIVVGKGAGARDLRIKLARFTLVGATTRFARLTSPLRSRFGIIERIDYYPEEEMEEIIARTCRILGIEIDRGAKKEIARRSRGTPRIANRLVRRIRDFAQVEGDGRITEEIARSALERLRIDRYGLDELERRLLKALVQDFGGGPVGLKTLAAALKEETETIEEIHEPYLIQKGFLARTPRGRVATAKARSLFSPTSTLF